MLFLALPFLYRFEQFSMQDTKNQCAGQGSQSICQPISRIIARAVFEKGLMEFIPDPDERQDKSNDQRQTAPGRFFAKEEGGNLGQKQQRYFAHAIQIKVQ